MNDNQQNLNEPTVWIVFNDTRKDFSKAENFGRLKDVFSSIPRNYDGATVIEHARHVLQRSTPEDYLLMVGDPALCAVCVTVMSEYHGGANLLRWDRERMQYNILDLDFGYEKYEDETSR